MNMLHTYEEKLTEMMLLDAFRCGLPDANMTWHDTITHPSPRRACMLQRYLDASARLEALKAQVDAALPAPVSTPPLSAGGGGNGSGGTTTTTTGKTTGGGGILSAQVDIAATVLSRDLRVLSEGDLLLIWER